MSRSSTQKLFDALEHERGPLPDRKLDRDFVNVAVNLGRIRRKAGWTQTELARRVGTSQPRIAEIEGAQSNPTLRTLARIAYALDVNLSVLVADNPCRERVFETYVTLGVASVPRDHNDRELHDTNGFSMRYDAKRDGRSYVRADNLAAVAYG